MKMEINKLVEEIIDNCQVSMISSVDSEGYPNTKAMLPPRKRDGIKRFYFSTNTSSIRVKQFKENQKASIYFYDHSKFKGIMFKGRMEVVSDLKAKEMIWRDGDELYYPKGIRDDDYCVLIFKAESARYYENFHSIDFKIK
ncbi:pyridoxamine 5'-phosphate oxidase family protein [Mycoplasmatota bacterium]|nr:pyridoxamine 5'-phosphate oxidase family protein [Mycoplasmatota bacterium]